MIYRNIEHIDFHAFHDYIHAMRAGLKDYGRDYMAYAEENPENLAPDAKSVTIHGGWQIVEHFRT